MTHGSIIGYDINAKMCQISYYNEKTQEPETVDTGIEKENNQIPLVMNYYKETWTYGRQARRMSTVRDSICVEGIWECALGNRKIEVDGQEYEGVQLLADFVKYTLNGFEEIESITFTVPEKNEDIRVLLKGIGQWQRKIFMFRTTRKASVIICLTSRKNYGSMKRHFFTVTRM